MFMDGIKSLIKKRVETIHCASNVLYIESADYIADNIHLETLETGYHILTMTFEYPVNILNSPLKTRGNNVIYANAAHMNEVDFLIRLNVLRMMLKSVAERTQTYFTIEEPGFNNGNI